jgi:hypothetical protein
VVLEHFDGGGLREMGKSIGAAGASLAAFVLA